MNRSLLAVVLILAALWLSPAVHAQCPLSFAAAVNYAVGNVPTSVAVGDFNADGRPDLAVTNSNGDNVSVFLNTGTGFTPPAIIQQPLTQIVQAGQNAAIAVTANGFGNTLTYQWRKNGIAIANGNNISGATSPTLIFSPANPSDTESYDVVVTSPLACGGGSQLTTSAAGVLAVTGANPCPADFNNDGGVDGSDVEAFFLQWGNGC